MFPAHNLSHPYPNRRRLFLGRDMGKKALSFSILLLFLATIFFAPTTFAKDDDDDDDDKRGSSAPPSASVSCSSKLTFNANLIPFGTSALKCYTAWTSQDFVLMYQQSDPGLWNFVLSAPNKGGYISVGFSPSGKMVGSSAVAGWLSSTGKGMARQYYLGGETPGACKPDAGSLPLVPNKTLIFSDSSRLYLAFQLNTTSEPGNKLVYALGRKGSIPGTDLLLEEHLTMVSTTIDYATGASSEEEESDKLTTAHGLLALIGWGVVVPIGILVARYGKRWDPFWFYSHLLIQFLGFGLGLAGIITGFKLEDEEGDEVDTHKAIGITILVLGSLQVMAFLARPDKASKVRKYWNWYHHYVGRAAVALAIGNIFYGLHLADEEKSWSVGYGVFLGVWVLVTLALEVGRCTARD